MCAWSPVKCQVIVSLTLKIFEPHFLALDAARVIVYYDENEESAVDIILEAVELGHFDEEESFTAQEESTLRNLIEEAIPLLEVATFSFAKAVIDAFMSIDDHNSFIDTQITEYEKLNDQLKYVFFKNETFFFFFFFAGHFFFFFFCGSGPHS